MAKALRVLRVILAAATAAVCLLLIGQAVDIYRVGNLPENFSAPGVRIHPVWSREIVGERLAAIAPFLFLYLALTVIALVLRAASEPEKERLSPSPEDTLALLRSRAAEVPAGAAAEQRRRRNVWLAAGAAVAVCILFSAVYLLRRENFTSPDLERVMGQMLLRVGPWTALGFAAAGAASVYAGKSVRREIELWKAAPRGVPAAVSKKSRAGGVRMALYAAAVLLVVLGVLNGGLWDVLVKAVNICTECIGLG